MHAGLRRGWPRRCAVEPPTEPAVCTRIIGLPDRAERVGEVQLGHHHALEHVGRLADDDRVDVGQRQPGVVERPVGRLAAQPGDRHVAALGAVLGLADADDGAARCFIVTPPSRTHDQVLLQARAAGRVGRRARSARPSMIAPRRLADADEPGGHHRVGGTARRPTG